MLCRLTRSWGLKFYIQNDDQKTKNRQVFIRVIIILDMQYEQKTRLDTDETSKKYSTVNYNEHKSMVDKIIIVLQFISLDKETSHVIYVNRSHSQPGGNFSSVSVLEW